MYHILRLTYVIVTDTRLFSVIDLDNGEALRELMLAEQDLFQNNFAQVLLGHAASGLASNYDLLISEFGGCPTPVLKGEPLSGKTTALKAILSVFGIRHFSSGRYI